MGRKPKAKAAEESKKTSADGKQPVIAPEKKPPKKGFNPKLVQEAVDFIREKANESVYKGSIEIGDYILNKFFGGEIELAKSKRPKKPASYNALCRHPDLVVHPSTLSIMVRVSAQEKLFAEKKLPVEKLSYSHKAELVKVTDDKEKVKLFKHAVAKSLSVRQLASEVKKTKIQILSDDLPPLLDAGEIFIQSRAHSRKSVLLR